MTKDELKKLLDNGDYIKIARLVGYTDLTYGRKYVYRVLSGAISGNKGKGKLIMDAAHVIAQRNAQNGKTSEE